MEIPNVGDAGPSKKQLLPEEAVPLFWEGIHLILSRWTALQLALENRWGGPGSHSLADQLASDIFAWFTRPSKEPLYIDDLEEILDQGMLSLNTETEDGSIGEVALDLMVMHEECLERDYSSIEKLRQAGPSSIAHQCVRQHADDEDDDEDDEDEVDDNMADDRTQMMTDAPGFHLKSNPVNLPVNLAKTKEEAQTDDGWQIASSRRNKGKKN